MVTDKKEIVVIGGGIIGSTTAYFLTRHPTYNNSFHKITLIEASQIAGGASGKAGGLLAKWAYPSSLVPLSYKLHEALAKEHGGEARWGYRTVSVGQLSAKGRHLDVGANGGGGGVGGEKEKKGESVSLQKRTKEAVGLLRAAGVPKDLDWFDAGSVTGYDEMGDPTTTAQVHPYQFTTSMADLAKEKGCEVVLGSVTKITYNESSPDSGVEYVTYTDKATQETKTIPATNVVIAAGPWTKSVFDAAPISALRAHSVTIRPSRPVSAYAVFTEISLPSHFGRSRTSSTGKSGKGSIGIQHVTPEIYARPNDEVYACGEGDTLVPLPPLSSDVQVDQSRCEDIVDYVSSISDELKDGEVTARQACYLPQVSVGGGPMIGETGIKGLLMAAGHTCWGIQNGPGTGKLISEFVFDGRAKSAGIGNLDPRKFLR